MSLQRNTRTVKKITHDFNHISKTRSYRGKIMLSDRELRESGRTLRNSPLLSIKQIFEESGSHLSNRTTHCRVIKRVSKVSKPLQIPLLSALNMKKRVYWAERYTKYDILMSSLLVNVELHSMYLMDGLLLTKVPHVDSEGRKEVVE